MVLSKFIDMNKEAVLPVVLLAGTSIGVVWTIHFIWKWTSDSKSRKVPGPRGWPIVGYMPYLLPANLHNNIKHLINCYGPIFKLRLGSLDTVFITDYQLIKKAFHNPEFSYRPQLYFFEFASKGFHGLASSSGELWQEQRRFALRHLRDLGMGKSSMDTHIQREALDMVESLKKTLGEPIDLNNSLNVAITNIVWALIAGKRMAHDDPLFLGFMAAIRHNMETGSSLGIVGFIPWLKDLLPRSWLGIDAMEESVVRVNNYFEGIVKEHRESFNPDDLRDYTDHFLYEQQKHRDDDKSTFTDDQLIVSMGDLFVAGGETTGTTIRWAVLLLSYHPEIQRKMQEEIDSVVGRDRLPSLDDRSRMPYTDAILHEVQRFADIAPMGLFHSNSEKDVEFEGFFIPKGTMITGYMGDCHRSDKYWVKPNEFYPEHFLNQNGQLKNDVEGFLPFSIGKRRCIGENLARVELFYFITYFFQVFNFTLCPYPKPSLNGDPKSGLVRWPSPYKVILESR